MATPTNTGQIHYNVINRRREEIQDTNTPGKTPEITFKVEVSTTQKFDNTGQINIYEDVLPQYFGTTDATIKKLGVQAKPGTKMLIKTSSDRAGEDVKSYEKLIIIGQTGVYEIDDPNLSIYSLRFVRPYRYQLDENQTRAKLIDGAKGMQEAEINRKVFNLNDLPIDYTTSEDNSEEESLNKEEFLKKWNKYIEAQKSFITKYNVAVKLYESGVNGIYTLPNPKNINDVKNYDELYNVIIDFNY